MAEIRLGRRVFQIEQQLHLLESLDDHNGTYRISLGSIHTQKQYKRLFAAFDPYLKDLFIEDISFNEDEITLHMLLATITKHTTRFGTFYEIESTLADTNVYKKGIKDDDNRRDTSIAKDKKTKRRRNTSQTIPS